MNQSTGPNATMDQRRWPTVLRIAGVALIIAGLQTWGFNRQTAALADEAQTQLAALTQETPDNRLMNLSLGSLQEVWKVASDDASKHQILELRDAVLQRFDTDPAAAVQELASIVTSFDARTVAEQESLATLTRHAMQLKRMYADHYGATIDAVSRPAWYLQPTASFLNNDRARNRALDFNHALYLMHVRDGSGAIETLTELRRDSDDDSAFDPLKSRIFFVLSRLQYQAFQAEPNQAYLNESLQFAQQSVRSDADYALAKLFLEFLLSVDQKAAEADVSPLEGEGSGEGEGERGAIATEAGEF